MARLSKTMRETTYKALAENEVELPWAFQVAAMGIYLLEALQAESCTQEELLSIAQTLSPVSVEKSSDIEFDLRKPRFAAMSQSVGPADRASSLFIADSLLPMINMGKPGSSRLQCWCEQLCSVFENAKVECPIMQAATAEILTMAKGVGVVVGATPESIDPLNAVMASKAGSKHTLKVALGQNSWYKQVVSELRTTWSAWLSLKPEIQKAETELRSTDPWGAVKPTTQSLISWRNALRPGATAACEAALADAFQQRFLQVSEAKDKAGLSEIIQELTICAKLPFTAGTETAAETYNKLLEECEQCQNSLAKSERKMKILQNFKEVAQMTKGTQCAGSLDAYVTFAERTQQNISEVWVQRAKQDIDDEMQASATATIPLIANGAATSLETAMLVVKNKPRKGKWSTRS